MGSHASFTKFAQFPKLPPEIRRIIWIFALVDARYSVPRLHWVTGRPCLDQVNKSSFGSPDSQPLGFHELSLTFKEPCLYLSSVPVHSILHTCHEARTAAIKVFNLVFAFGTFINFRHDSIFLDVVPERYAWYYFIKRLPNDFQGLLIAGELRYFMAPHGAKNAEGKNIKCSILSSLFMKLGGTRHDLVLLPEETYWTSSLPSPRKDVETYVALERKWVQPFGNEQGSQTGLRYLMSDYWLERGVDMPMADGFLLHEPRY